MIGILMLLLLSIGCARLSENPTITAQNAVQKYLGANTAIISDREDGDTHIVTLSFTSNQQVFGMEGPNITTNHTVVVHIRDGKATSIIADGTWDAMEGRSLMDITARQDLRHTQVSCGGFPLSAETNFRNGSVQVIARLQRHCGNITISTSGDQRTQPPELVIALTQESEEKCPELTIKNCSLMATLSFTTPLNETFGGIRVTYEGDDIGRLAFGNIPCKSTDATPCPQEYICTGRGVNYGRCVLNSDTMNTTAASIAYGEYEKISGDERI